MSLPSGAISVASRTRWFVLALLPVLASRSVQAPAFAILLALSVALALPLSLLASWFMGQPLRLAWLDEANWATALLLPLWFGIGLSPAWLAVALLAATVSRLPFGGMGQQVFHPAMVGIALLLLFGQLSAGGKSQSAPDPILEIPALVLAASLLGWRLRRDLRAPMALLLAFGAVTALLHALGPSVFPDARAWAQLSLAALLVANDPVTAPSRPAARWVFGASAGVAAALLPGAVDGLPFALLGLQAVAPWLDRNAAWRPDRRRGNTVGHAP